MRYQRFTIVNYRAIRGPLVVDLERDPLIPIIGVNESGKTTILHAIFAFDSANDDLNGGRQLLDTNNLYSLDPAPALITAEVSLELGELQARLLQLKSSVSSGLAADALERILAAADSHEGPIRISRHLLEDRYSTDLTFIDDEKEDTVVGQFLVNFLPWILFFDDFRDSVDDRTEIVKGPSTSLNSWLAIVERLFQEAGNGISVFRLPDMEDRQRKTLLSRVNKYLNETLTREWQTFRIDDSEALEIEITFEPEHDDSNTMRNYLRLSIAERTADRQRYFFNIRDRSKGFFWFFNFVMKLQFNPKVMQNSQQGTVYLLDEPGSYLHSGAQRRLCKKLVQIARTNGVIYCTHSHYLLDPETIPVGTIKVANKDDLGTIELFSIYDYNGKSVDRHSAFQPVLDALEVQQFSLELGRSPTVITEGMFDLYAISLFGGPLPFTILPGTGAETVQYHISRLVAWQVPFVALWDNDEEGRKAEKKARKNFGAEIADSCFRLLPLKGPNAKKRILQNLLAGDDLRMIKDELGLARNSSFEKTILLLYHSDRRDEIVALVSQETRANFADAVSRIIPRTNPKPVAGK